MISVLEQPESLEFSDGLFELTGFRLGLSLRNT